MLVHRKSLIILGYCSFTLFMILAFGYQQGAHEKIPELVKSWSPSLNQQQTHHITRKKLLKGAPKTLFRDNLLPEEKYITGWATAGFTNQFMGVSNLLYIATLTQNRIPILAPFLASHLPEEAGTLSASEVFDLDRWSRSIHHPILEWKDVKELVPYTPYARSDGTEEFIGCWSTLMTGNLQATNPGWSPNLNVIGLDISHTPVPKDFRAKPDDNSDTFITTSSLASLSDPETRTRILQSMPALAGQEASGARYNTHASGRGKYGEPDDHLLCFDDTYYVVTHSPWEFNLEWSPVWNFVGRHAHWSHTLRSTARKVLARTLGVKPSSIVKPGPGDEDYHGLNDDAEYTLEELDLRDQVTHPYIVIHARHGDFGRLCDDGPCFTPLDTYEVIVKEIIDEIYEKKNVTIRPGDVIMTSDEQDEEWWKDVRAKGWKRVVVDDEDLPEGPKGLWYKTLVEVVIQGWAKGFIGTTASTMSIFGGRRARSWQDGIARQVKWGPHLYT